MIKQKLIAAIGGVALLIGAPIKITAQTTNVYNFTISLPDISSSPLSGSVGFNINNFVLNASFSSTTEWRDTVDLMTFNGTTYNNLIVDVLNNNTSGGGSQDGFAITGSAGSQTLILRAFGDNTIINDTTIPDLLTALDSFNIIQSGSSPNTTVDYWANYPDGHHAGTLTSFEIQPAPEPSTMALSGFGSLSLLLFRRRK